jgi:2',3'-cyclic-nucleotide 2'-phosphodiesterase/3'-nucleotidase
MMKKLFIYILLSITLLSFSGSKYTVVRSQDQNKIIKIYHTSDIHGNFFPFDFINNTEAKGSLARVSEFIKREREEYPDALLLDGGDVLQGQPSVYYANFIDTLSPHLGASVLNYIGYDALVMGNHDIEAGHSVYDRWIKDCKFPVLGANILTMQNQPYVTPYTVFYKGGIKIAVLGMITSAIPAWLPEYLWKGLHFEELSKTAEYWLPIIKREENPDIIVGLLHTGVQTSYISGYKESEGIEIARQIPGFDILFCGHDHTPFCQKVANNEGDSVLLINPGAGGNLISNVTLELQLKNGLPTHINISGKLDTIRAIQPDEAYLNYFSEDLNKTYNYVNTEIGELENTISGKDAWFGPSALVDFFHSAQLAVTGADISFAAPLSLNTTIDSGKIYIRDMFKLYRYENTIYTMSLSGKEIKDALEYSYGLWTNQMKSETDHLLLIKPDNQNNRYRFVNSFLSFDSSAGIIYTVDVTKPIGEKVEIISMSDGRAFDMNYDYKVAINSYQGSGGGEVLTKGSGIPQDMLKNRILASTPLDFRFYLIEEFKKTPVRTLSPLNQWTFIPKDWVLTATQKDCRLLFGE